MRTISTIAMYSLSVYSLYGGRPIIANFVHTVVLVMVALPLVLLLQEMITVLRRVRKGFQRTRATMTKMGRIEIHGASQAYEVGERQWMVP